MPLSRAAAIWPTSSWLLTPEVRVRSPSARPSASLETLRTDLRTLPATRKPISRLSRTPAASTRLIVQVARVAAELASAICCSARLEARACKAFASSPSAPCSLL